MMDHRLHSPPLVALDPPLVALDPPLVALDPPLYIALWYVVNQRLHMNIVWS